MSEEEQIENDKQDLEATKVKFNERIQKFYSGRVEKDIIKKCWTADRVKEVIEDIKSGKLAVSTGNKRSNKQYHSMRKYEVLSVGVDEYLVVKRSSLDQPIVYITPIEQYFDVLLECHRNTGHGGRDKMLFALKNEYNIPRKAVEIFISLCKECQLKKSQSHKGSVVPSIVSKDFNVLGQVDLMDFQSTPDGKHKWLLSYQDYATKFLHLRPLQSNRAAEVAIELMKIFLEFGAPHILQSGNGREFTALVLEEIVNYWPGCEIANCQDSMEVSNQDVENSLRSWMSDNSSTNWSLGCYFVQWQKNSSRYGTIGSTPYRALFGADPKLGLQVTNLPDSVIKELRTEEELEDVMHSSQTDDTEEDLLNNTEEKANENLSYTIMYCCVCSEKIVEQSKLTCEVCNGTVHLNCTFLSSGPSSKPEIRICSLCTTEDQIEHERQKSYSAMKGGKKRAAGKMTETSNEKLKSIKIE